jgi:hypothetical protein
VQSDFTTHFAECSPLFAPLRGVIARGELAPWPNRERLTQLARDAQPPVLNAAGQRIAFVAPSRGERSAAGYELRIAHKAAVEHREENWHDLLNALVWLTYPRAKAALNRRHVLELAHEQHARRSPTRDALTQFDEDGIVVASERADLLELLRGFQWAELFWNRRADVMRSMRWYVFGHAQYEKAMRPFVGMTAKAITFQVARGFCNEPYGEQLAQIDRMSANSLACGDTLGSARALTPVPILGIPGWSTQSAHASFYEDRSYFRTGRRCAAP